MKIVGVIANVGITGDFKNQADKEKKSGDRYTLWALVLMLVIVVAVVFTLYAAMEQGWQEGIYRVGIILSLSFPAGYMVREADKHRQLERRYRRMELELSSVDSYLEGLDPNKIEEIKVKLADKYFGQIEEPIKVDRKQRKILNELLETVVKNIQASK